MRSFERASEVKGRIATGRSSPYGSRAAQNRLMGLWAAERWAYRRREEEAMQVCRPQRFPGRRRRRLFIEKVRVISTPRVSMLP